MIMLLIVGKKGVGLMNVKESDVSMGRTHMIITTNACLG
jgi:hypothetical protein